MNEDLLFEPDPKLFYDKFVGPKGSANPHIYIIGEAPGKDEVEAGLPFVGKAGQTLHRTIELAGLPEDQIRFFNALPYRPFEISQYGNHKNRTPTNEEIEFYKVFLLKDIENTKPECIVAAGRSAMLALGIDERINRAREDTYYFKGIPVFCTWHPSYVMQADSPRITDEAVADLKRAWGHKEQKSSTIDYEIVDVLEFSKIEQDLWEHDTLVLDYEASGLKPYQADFHLAGIAIKGLGAEKSYYIRFWDFWRRRNEFDIPEGILHCIGLLLAAKRLIVFNMQFECAVTLSIFGQYVTNVIDLMLWNRMLGNSGGLKQVAQTRLNITKWADEVDIWNDCCEILFKNCSVTHKGNARHEMVYISEGHTKFDLEPARNFEDVLIYLVSKFNIQNLDALEQDMKPREYKVFKAFDTLDQLVRKYYQGEKLEEFCQRFFALLRERSEDRDDSIRYTDIPTEILVPYAIEDIVHTDELFFNFSKEIEEKGLVRTAEIYNSHGKLGFEIESSGIAWDNDRAAELDREYSKVSIETLRKLLTSPKMLSILKVTDQDILKIQTTTNIDDLTSFFNPNSNHETTKDMLSNLLITGRVRFTRMLYEIFKDWSPRSEEDRNKNFPVLYPLIEQLLEIKNPAERIELVEELVQNIDIIKQKVAAHPGNDSDKWRDTKKQKVEIPELEMLVKFYKWELPGTAADVMENLFEAFESILGIDVDNQKTWIPEFQHLIWFKQYKKVMKNWSSYVWGKNGRGSISQIDMTDIGRLRNKRIPGHIDNKPNSKIWILGPEMGILTAVTKRWKSSQHVIPAESELLDLRVSRFPDGIRIHYDYSQQELRILAHLSQDRNLLDAFNRGEDVHLFIASKVWKKPKEEITKSERRFSKSATFAIAYGDIPSGFAVKFMHGDVPAAEALFKSFYEGFPDIQVWIKKQHRLSLDNNGIIYTLLGDPLDVDMPYQALQLSNEDKDLLAEHPYTQKVSLSDNWREDKLLKHKVAKSFRNGQNYPIQSLSSVLAGLGINYMREYLRQNNMTSRIDLFTHDSGDIDAQIADVPRIVSMIPETSVKKIYDEFGISVKTDVEIGITANTGIELSGYTSNGNGIINGKFKAKKPALLAVIDKLERHNVRCTYDIKESEIEKSSVKDLFKAKKAYSIDIGNPKEILKGSISLDFSRVDRIPI
jgi:uracil-DNA glycosylase family 4